MARSDLLGPVQEARGRAVAHGDEGERPRPEQKLGPRRADENLLSPCLNCMLDNNPFLVTELPKSLQPSLVNLAKVVQKLQDIFHQVSENPATQLCRSRKVLKNELIPPVRGKKRQASVLVSPKKIFWIVDSE